MEIIGKLTKDGVKSITVKSTGETMNVGQYHIEGIGERADAVAFEVLDGDKGRLAQFDQYANKVCSVSLSLSVRLYNSRYYTEIRGWAVKSIT